MTDRVIEHQRIERKRVPIVQNLRQRIKKEQTSNCSRLVYIPS